MDKGGASTKDTFLSWSDLEYFQSLKTAHYPRYYKKNGRKHFDKGKGFWRSRKDKTHPLLRPLHLNSWSLSLGVGVLGTDICSRGLHGSYIQLAANTQGKIKKCLEPRADVDFYHYLSLQSQGACWHQRLTAEHTGVVHQVTGGDVVRAVSNNIIYEGRKIKESSQIDTHLRYIFNTGIKQHRELWV